MIMNTVFHLFKVYNTFEYFSRLIHKNRNIKISYELNIHSVPCLMLDYIIIFLRNNSTHTNLFIYQIFCPTNIFEYMCNQKENVCSSCPEKTGSLLEKNKQTKFAFSKGHLDHSYICNIFKKEQDRRSSRSDKILQQVLSYICN